MKITHLLCLLCLGISLQLQALNPSRTYKQRPEKYNMEYKETKVKTNDGQASLNSWYFPAKTKTTQLVLIAHNGEGNMADYLRRVDQFRSDYNVVIFDYRGYGESSEFEIDNKMYIYPHFQDDMATMIDFCRKNYTSQINLYGWGVGAGLALGVGWNRSEIIKIIADTPFLSMEDLEERFSDWDEPMEVPFAGYDKRHEPFYALSEVNPGKQMQKVKLIIGSNDVLFKLDDMKKLYALKKEYIDKNIYVVENPDRKDNFRVDKAGYYATVKSFLGK
jgi:pimeloyl-ACP methyl ester carboxylesterase